MEEEVKKLKKTIQESEKKIKLLESQFNDKHVSSGLKFSTIQDASMNLNSEEIRRYSRQLILPEIGMAGQLALKSSSILIVGAGGLGCPVGMYLSASGVGTIGIVDHDIVDINNLHRQIAHTEETVGVNKCLSFSQTIQNINSNVNCVVHSVLLNSGNIENIIENYDVIVDATDNVPTRYLLNDAAVLFKKPLVSGSALRFEGQLTVYNYKDGPCYRCLFPNPPSPGATTNCSEGGVLGAVTGVIGSLQALEVIKIILGISPSYSKKMLIFDGLSGEIRVINLRSKKLNCDICSVNPSVKKLIDYELFCNAAATDKDNNLSLLSDVDRVTCSEYKTIVDSGTEHILIDVRPSNEVSICSLPNSFNVPLNEIIRGEHLDALSDLIGKKNFHNNYVICRRGNDSQKAVLLLQKLFKSCTWQDIKGGLLAWHDEIDSTFPTY